MGANTVSFKTLTILEFTAAHSLNFFSNFIKIAKHSFYFSTDQKLKQQLQQVVVMVVAMAVQVLQTVFLKFNFDSIFAVSSFGS